jgi:RNA polymerase sigma-B factor
MTATASHAGSPGSAQRSHREDHELRRRAVNGDEQARQRLIEKHLSLAAHLARRYASRGEPFEDLVQVARLGLTKAAGRWDPCRGAFTTYAVPTILGELRRYFRDSTWPVRPPRGLQETYLAVARVRDQLGQQLGREPTVDDFSSRLGLPRRAIVEALGAAQAHRPASLDRPLRSDASPSPTYRDALVDRRDDIQRCEDAITLSQLCAELTARDREVVRLRFQSDMIQSDIAARMGCSQMHISRILRESLLRMQKTAERAPATD